MRLLSLNVGLYEKNNAVLPEFLVKKKPDILCLQEVTRKAGSGAKSAFITKPVIDKATGNLPYSFYAPLWQTDSHKTTNYHNDPKYRLSWGGQIEFGNYVKSKIPISFGSNVFVENHFSYVTDWSDWPGQDYRAVQYVDLSTGTKPLRIINYHGIWTRDKLGNHKTLEAVRMIKALADSSAGAVVIAGDFNLFPDTASLDVLNKSYVNLPLKYKIKTTRPRTNELSFLATNIVDYIFVNSFVEVKKFMTIDEAVSDHLALLLDFEINNQE